MMQYISILYGTVRYTFILTRKPEMQHTVAVDGPTEAFWKDTSLFVGHIFYLDYPCKPDILASFQVLKKYCTSKCE